MTVLSIITPCYNEEAGIAQCYEAVRAVMAAELPQYDYEHIFIDNCSQDRTVAILREIAASDRRVKMIVNSRNFGPERSPFHAILQSSGDATTPILADLQTPPALIPRMVRLWRERAKAVIAVKRSSDDRMLWRSARDAYYKAMKKLSKVEQIPNYMGYGLYDKCVIEAMRGLREPEPYFRGLVMEVEFSGRWWNMTSRRAKPGDRAIVCSRWPIMRCWGCSVIRGRPCVL